LETFWTDERKLALVRAVGEAKVHALFPDYNVSYLKVLRSKFRKELKARGFDVPETGRQHSYVVEEAEALEQGTVDSAVLTRKDQQIELLTTVNKALKARLAGAISGKSVLEALRYTSDEEAKLVRASFASLGSSELPIPNIIHKHPQDAVLFESCLHYGEVVSLAETGGISSYDIPTAQAAYQVLTEATLDLLRNHHSGEQFETVWVIDVGDNVSGDIHDELKITNERPIVSQVKGAALLKSLQLRDIARHFKRVVFVGLPGNHARTTRKPSFKQKSEDSFDRAVYEDMALLLSQIPNVEMRIPRSSREVVNINGHNFMFEHGDSIPSWMGIPFYGAQREDAKLTKLYTNYFNQGFRYFGFGHFHQVGFLQTPGGGEMIMTGSPKGGDEFSLGRLSTASQPSQILFGVHPTRGVSFRYPLDLSTRDPEIHTEYQFELSDMTLLEAAKGLGLL
jgi:hypothetical protein